MQYFRGNSAGGHHGPAFGSYILQEAFPEDFIDGIMPAYIFDEEQNAFPVT